MSHDQTIRDLTAAEALEKSSWGIGDAMEVYNIDRWGLGYFDVNERGQLTCRPLKEEGAPIPLMEIVDEAKRMGLGFPLQIRFQDLLRHRVQSVNGAFQKAIQEQDYQNIYRGVFPLKVNQLREVIEEILDAGEPFNHGLEVGSRAELVAALAINEHPEAPLICNGYKDDAFIRLALLGLKVGRSVFLVIEKIDEVERIIRLAEELQVAPRVGIRMRLHSKGSGPWAESSGDYAKFGLNASEALQAWEMLQTAHLEASLQLIHFHIGSQIPDIGHIKQAVREATRYYAKFRQIGAPLEYLDVGGGLAIDYDGSGTAFHSSMNYTLQEYASSIVTCIRDVCDEEKVSHPLIVSESGRSTVAHHSVLIVEAFSSVQKRRYSQGRTAPCADENHKLLSDIEELRGRLDEPDQLLAVHHSLQDVRNEAVQLFDVGLLDLKTKARVDDLYWELTEEIVRRSEAMREHVPEEIAELAEKVSDQYVCNFSIFQSLLDNWAMGQQFPIVPIHRLDEKPLQKGTLVDITCDSEGKIDAFTDLEQEAKAYLPLHSIGEMPYYLGVFLSGAYQDIMGDQHNLFGRINELHVFLDDEEECGYYVEEILRGSTVAEVLRNTQYEPYELIRKFKASVDRAIRNKSLKSTQGMRILEEYRSALEEYTYLKHSE